MGFEQRQFHECICGENGQGRNSPSRLLGWQLEAGLCQEVPGIHQPLQNIRHVVPRTGNALGTVSKHFSVNSWNKS